MRPGEGSKVEYLYHGSAVGGIQSLRAGSILHGTGERVLYLTDSAPYALFYIWDENRTGFSYKHITAWLKDGLAQYEEQFPGQLEAFYRGASGWLYRVERTREIQLVEGREGLFCALGDTAVAEAAFVPDVYEALLAHEAKGRAKLWRFEERPPEKREELMERAAQWIARNGFFPGREEAAFFRQYFPEAWLRAESLGETPGKAK